MSNLITIMCKYNLLASLMTALVLAFGATSVFAECRDSMAMSDFEQVIKEQRKVVLNTFDVLYSGFMRYGSAKVTTGIPLDKFDDNKINDFLDNLDECTESSRLLRLKRDDGSYRYSDNEKQLFIENIKRMQRPFIFINEFTSEQIVSNDLKLSCTILMNSGRAYVSAKQPNSLLLGKPLSSYETSDFNKIRNKLNQCLELVRATYDGFALNREEFEKPLLSISSAVTSWESERNLLSAMIDNARKEKERKESFSYVTQEWVSSAGDKLGKAILIIGIIIIAIASNGLVKRDKRFKTGRVNNENDAPWATKLGALGFVVGLIGGTVILISSWIAPI